MTSTFRKTKPGTIGHWIKDVSHTAGVDMEVLSTYYMRSAGTSWAASENIPTNDILKAVKLVISDNI